MPVTKKEIVVICYVFPPYPGTGGRRWAKFAKYLAKSGYSLNVIAAKNNSKNKSSWEKDIKHENIRVHYLPSFYPQTTYSDSFLHRIFHFIYSKPIKIFTSKNYLDKSIYWQKFVYTRAKRLLRNLPIQNVIATAAPFGYLDTIVKLKLEFPSVNFILDIRDTKDFFLQSLPQKIIQNELVKEKEVINRFDIVLTVSEYLTEKYKSMLHSDRTKIFTLCNGFDRDDFYEVEKNTNQKARKQGDKIKFVYTGNLIPECSIYTIAFLKALLKLKEEQRNIYDSIEVNIFGNKDQETLNFSRKNNISNVFFHGHVLHNIVVKEISDSDFCLIFPADFYADYSLETKFFEYCYLRKPIVVFPEKGACSELVVKNNLGVALPVENTYHFLLKLLEEYSNGKFMYNYNFDLSAFDVKSMCLSLEEKFI